MKYLASLAIVGFVAIMAAGPPWLVFLTLWILLAFPVAVFAGRYIKTRSTKNEISD